MHDGMVDDPIELQATVSQSEISETNVEQPIREIDSEL
jgi:hypothetical protein